MKNLFCVLLLSFFCLHISAQNFHLNLSLGVTNYSGDLQPERFTFNQSHPSIAAGLSYQVSEKFFIRSQIMFGKVSAYDKFNPSTAIRNLNFTSSITELQVAGEYYLRDLSDYSVAPYLFAGIAAYHFNPYTNDSAGTKYYLQPLSTEGQGFYQNKKLYNLTQFAIPFGGGIKLALSDNIHVGIEIGMRKLFTDYLDDVSTTYVDPNLLLANRGPKSVELAYRESELKNGLPYQTGENRGGAKFKDWYYFTGITTSIRLGNGNGRGGSQSKLGCPPKVR
jgi:hypothetical protein